MAVPVGLRIPKFLVYAIAAVTLASAAGSLLVFGIFLWRGGFELVGMGMASQVALAWDAALSLLFFVQHSGMVRRQFRAWFGRLAAPAWHGIWYTLASSAALLLVMIFWQRSHIELVHVEGPFRWAIRGIFLASLGGFIWGAGVLKNFDLSGVGAMLYHVRGEQAPSTPFSIAGPYRWVRHPFYISVIVAIWACPTLSLDRLVFDLLWTLWIATGAVLEERDLVTQFGDAYRAYQRHVPMLVPWRRPEP